ncbi:hypothetical protein GCM10025867_20700 [Frondihabitans sucicola]|uniref:Succinyl-diaminopimelate desuccinylase n=1 Tax=Frondihabitans sucicola TaxID=1268041 RepID=A0ABM8GN27_9MICO|nr:hypothetical protein GCM10025867_20700 [Frondihabitans sucicola]
MPALDLTVSSIDLTRQLCDIESVSGDEQRIADEIWRVLGGAAHLDVFRDGDALVARTNLGRAKRVVIAGHIDTVPINDNVPTRFETIDGTDYLWGRGTVDMKAGCAVALKLAVELDEPAVDVTWVWYDHEEVSDALNGLGRLARQQPELLAGDFAILMEPSNSSVEGGCNGNLRAEIRTYGLRSHSARSWIGDNAIHKAAPILDLLAAYEARQVEVDGLVYREGLNAVGITGGVAGNVIPDECMVHVNYRFAPSRSTDEAVAHIRELFGEFDVTIVDLAQEPGRASTPHSRKSFWRPSEAKPSPNTAGPTSPDSPASVSPRSTTVRVTRSRPMQTTNASLSSRSPSANEGSGRG